MAIYTGGMRQKAEARKAARNIAAQQAQAEAGETKRKGRSKLFGNIGGFLAGEGAEIILKKILKTALAAATGGASVPLTTFLTLISEGGKYAKLAKAVVKGGALTLTKDLVDKATKSKHKILKTPGQVEKITADNKYGYGEKEARTLSEALTTSRESTGQDAGTLLANIGGSFASQIAGEKLGGLLGKGKDFVDTGVPFQETEAGGWGVDPNKGGGFMEWLQSPNTEFDILTGEEKYTSQLFSPKEDAPFDLEGYLSAISDDFAQGGQVPQLDQNALLELAILSEMENQDKAYDDTPLEEENQQQTIAGYFASQGKTLGGNNTQSLSQILGR